MADHSKPTTTSLYTDFVTELDGRLDDLALGLDPATTTPTNIPTNSIRWSSAANKWQKWNGTTWNDLSSGYAIPISGVSVAATTLTASGNVTLGDATSDTITLTGTVQPGVVVSGSSTGDALRITQTGTGNCLVVEDSANPDSTPFVIDGLGQIVSGHTAAVAAVNPANGVAMTPVYQAVTAAAAGSASFGASAWFASGAQAGSVVLAKSNSGVVGTHGIVGSGTLLGSISFQGSDGAAFARAADINVTVDTAPATGSMPGRLVFSTTPSGSSTPVERMRIDSAGRVGIGTTPSGFNFHVGAPLYGASSSYCVRITSEIKSDVTTLATGFSSQMAVEAAAFTAANIRHFEVAQGTIGAGASITNQSGFFVNSNLTGATNNYGFYGNIPAGAGRWNFYANGTANNAFAGNTRIGGTTAPTCALDVTGGIQTSRTAVIAPAATDGNIFSGTYTPTQVSTNTNVDSITFSECQYMRVGSVVTVSGQITIDATTAAADTIARISLPIASAFTVGRSLGGSGAALTTPYASSNTLAMAADATNDCVEIRLRPTVNTAITYAFTFTYQVV